MARRRALGMAAAAALIGLAALGAAEMQTFTRDRLLNYFTSHGYVPIEHYRHADTINMYFRRRDA